MSVQSNHAALANTSTLYRESRYSWRCLEIEGRLECNVNLNPLRLSVSPSFHHVSATVYFITDSP